MVTDGNIIKEARFLSRRIQRSFVRPTVIYAEVLLRSV